MFIQSFGEDGYSRLKLRRKDLIKIGGFDLNDYKDMALFTLLIQVKRFLFSHPEYSAPYKIVIDEGRKPNGAVQPCVMFGNLLQDEQILYESSAYDVLLQIALIVNVFRELGWVEELGSGFISEFIPSISGKIADRMSEEIAAIYYAKQLTKNELKEKLGLSDEQVKIDLKELTRNRLLDQKGKEKKYMLSEKLLAKSCNSEHKYRLSDSCARIYFSSY